MKGRLRLSTARQHLPRPHRGVRADARAGQQNGAGTDDGVIADRDRDRRRTFVSVSDGAVVVVVDDLGESADRRSGPHFYVLSRFDGGAGFDDDVIAEPNLRPIVSAQLDGGETSAQADAAPEVDSAGAGDPHAAFDLDIRTKLDSEGR